MRNIILIIVDSVRNYSCPADRIDDRGRITLMDELADTWIDFRTVVTSAPSTLMSLAAMLTSCPSYYLGTGFVDFRLDGCSIPTIKSILQPYGYKTYFTTLLPYEREAWATVLEGIPRKLWAKGLKHRFEWKNPSITQTVRNLVSQGMDEPFFFLLHYCCRGDEQISQNVRDGLDALESSGYMDNSVVFLTSDHGYPDPFRREEVERLGKYAMGALKHRKLPHDLIMTDDNILVPLLVRYPGHSPKRIEEQVCTLDYLPTSLELAGITDYPQLHGQSLVPLLEGREIPELRQRKLRIDGRFLGQPGRCTAIRSAKRKYIYYHDLPEAEREQFYDLVNDSLEVNNLIKTGTQGYEADIEDFKAFFAKEEEYGHALQKDSIRKKYLEGLNKHCPQFVKAGTSVLCFKFGSAGFDRLFEDILCEIHGPEYVKCVQKAEAKNIFGKRYDLVLGGLLEYFGNKQLFKNISNISAERKLLVDLHINLIRYSRLYILTLFRMDWQLRKKYYLREPLYLWGKIRTVLRRILFGPRRIVKSTDYDYVNPKLRKANADRP